MLPSEKFFFSLLVLSLFGYLILRTINVPIVGDEAATFFNYVNVNQFLPGIARTNTNNHILNSFLTIISCNLFGNTLLPLRLANLLSSLIYFGAVYAIGKRVENRLVRWSFYSALLFSTFLIEFFALSRGYGLSIAFLMASLYYLFKVLEEGGRRYYLLCISSISLATLANLTLFNTLVILTGFLLLISLLKQSIKENTTTWVIGSTSIVLLGALSLFYKSKGLLWYGGDDGFWCVTIATLSKSLFSNVLFPSIAVGIILVASIVIVCVLFCNKNRDLLTLINAKYILIYILFANIILTYCLALILGVNFPKERGALYFLPLIICAGAFAVNELAKFWKPYAILLLFLFYFPIHFFANANLSHSTYWPKECLPVRFYDTILKTDKTATIGGNRLHQYTWGYLNFIKGGELNHWQSRDYPSVLPDFQIIDLSDYPGSISRYTLLDFDSISNLSLVKHVNDTTVDSILSIQKNSFDNSQRYFSLFSFELDTIDAKLTAFTVEFELEGTSSSPFFKCELIVKVENEKKELSIYENYPLDWKITNFKGPISGRMYIPKTKTKGATLSCFISNMNQSSIRNLNSKITLHKTN